MRKVEHYICVLYTSHPNWVSTVYEMVWWQNFIHILTISSTYLFTSNCYLTLVILINKLYCSCRDNNNNNKTIVCRISRQNENMEKLVEFCLLSTCHHIKQPKPVTAIDKMTITHNKHYFVWYYKRLWEDCSSYM